MSVILKPKDLQAVRDWKARGGYIVHVPARPYGDPWRDGPGHGSYLYVNDDGGGLTPEERALGDQQGGIVCREQEMVDAIRAAAGT